MRRPFALTMGDPAGIGPELTLKAWRRLRRSAPCFFWLGDPSLLRGCAPYVEIDHPDQAGAVFGEALPVMTVPCPHPVQPGVPDSRNAEAVIRSIERATHHALNGGAGGVVTNPIAKHILVQSGFSFPGHTEFLASLCGVAGEEVMMLASPQLKVVPVSIHVSLREAIEGLTTERIVDVSRRTATALRRDFGIVRPRLAIAGLNPHAGENGLMGEEERLIIEPAVQALTAQGVEAFGPMPPDTMFSAACRPRYDAAICLYHDQALIPLKTLDMSGGVNVTLGLPIIRTSPDHGTAFDIAAPVTAEGGSADVSSLLAALSLAGAIAGHRYGESV